LVAVSISVAVLVTVSCSSLGPIDSSLSTIGSTTTSSPVTVVSRDVSDRERGKGRGAPEPLAFQTYRDHQLLLALHLKPDDRDDVRAAYVYAWAPRVFIRTGDGTAQSIRTSIEAAKNKTERAMVVLGWVAAELPGAYKDL
jgi:hypothetical protein